METPQIEDLRDPVLVAIIDNLQLMQLDMQQMARCATKTAIINHINCASLDQCKTIVDALVDRVIDLVGCATELEDAACMIQKELDADTERENA